MKHNIATSAKVDIMKKITLFAAILSCVAIAVLY